MTQQKVLARFEQLLHELQTNFNRYDPKLLETLIDEIYKRVTQCYYVDPQIVTFLQNKAHFKSLKESKAFVKTLTGICSSKRRIKDAATENAQILVNQGFTLDKLSKKFQPEPEKGDTEIAAFLQNKKNFKSGKVSKAYVKALIGSSSSKRGLKDAATENAQILVKHGSTIDQLQAKYTAQKPSPTKVIPDMAQTWLRLQEPELKSEFATYLNASDLKKAAVSLLKSSDKRLHARAKVEARILERIREKKALFRLGQ